MSVGISVDTVPVIATHTLVAPPPSFYLQ